MKFHYARSVPEQLYVACSGGVDSVVAAHVMSTWRSVTLLHYHHGDAAGDAERACVSDLAQQLNLPLLTAEYQGHDIMTNAEATWRQARYRWFHEQPAPVMTAHTLDDAMEWYMMTCLRGQGHYMEYQNHNVIRPFLLTTKSDLMTYAQQHGLTWWQDPSNSDPEYALRNRVRSQLIPAALHCEPGLRQMVKRRIMQKLLTDK